ncbi:phosphoethanolamine--lipid A transferase [Testudinibacter sp. TR-2022]|uniref:phosphoethanolamine transferase n=1 Tax=Testudinibacter sp. TR-2022 TaxID=2585029 RepID=UPI001117F18D|nr:phosphoethanolamine--lipid A transferase [Testudinibacter sp. TR-2022]TNH02736.1 phosphoethanolamine--lipid A transferase [Pasteurellaceae bacterium Phil31]TNH05883.1 phosphoethanolamine--lipid A transferase [Testudinibacter sp. TR-2022]TNH11240.1 phosphoethanolamine--lipid A transferase [Testudinibacter sp. TR-2022]TNH12427.1 phosphoethanolamine--lipid A transferase [Testudinibacter sp. TR-2022]TNH19396.1 phosphoethanolamine--lipid A transferase [Testudinibacter sp. TR-2022]
MALLSPRFLSKGMSSSKLLLLLTLFFTVVMNYAFYKTVLALYPNIDMFALSLPFAMFFILYAAFQILALPYLHKILIPLLLLLSASIGYNALFYNVYFDTNMLENVLQTSFTEASKLITFSYILWIVVFGVVPSILYVMVKVNYRTWYKEIAMRLLLIALSVVVVGSIAKFYYQDYASFFRNNKQVVNLIVPSNFIGAGINEVKRIQQANRPFEQIGLDAQQVKQDGQKRRVLVLVVGETTRAQNWGLNGYQVNGQLRQTTPKLAALGSELINYPQVTSCGTATAVSVPCMFSVMDRSNFNSSVAQKQDNLLDIAQRSGINILWLDNDTGCKGVCERVPTENLTGTNSAEFCHNGECLDDILLQNFEQRLQADPNKDLIVVLHTMGSHGPTYFERYTSEYRHFTPTCDMQDIAKCSKEQLVNTYDNTILYIDQFLDRVINTLKKQPNLNSALLYVSDHGESLGENGIYLHGTPYSIAPDEQTHVPAVFWASQGLQAQRNLDLSCLQKTANTTAYSQDNYFHSVLGLMQIKTALYNPTMDMFAGCRR